jgi:hypothetical protein
MAKLPTGTNKTSYVTDKKTGKAAIVNPKKVQEAGVGSVGKMAVKLGVKAAQKVVKAATASPKVKAEAKALKAANKPTNKTGTKADRSDRKTLQGQNNLIKQASPARANRTRGGSLAAIKAYGGQGLATVKLSPKESARQASLSKDLNPVRKKSK